MSGPPRRLRGASHLSLRREKPDMQDRRCRFGLAARIEMVRRRASGQSLREIAAALACSPTTVKTQCDRWAAASDERARGLRPVCIREGPFRSRVRGRSLPSSSSGSSMLARRRMGRRCDSRSSAAAGTVRRIWKVLAPPWRLAAAARPRQTLRRFEWSRTRRVVAHRCASRAEVRPAWAPGHRLSRPEEHAARNLGETVVIAVHDDHTRLVYCRAAQRRERTTTSRSRSSAPPRGCASRAAARSRRS